MRIVIMGNSGSGKSTLARHLARTRHLALLDLDTVAWGEDVTRLPIERSLALIDRFRAEHACWVIEGCYGDLIEAIAHHADELHFLDVGIATCMSHCRSRPWEPHKYATAQEQDAMLKPLLDWVSQYDQRTDEFARSRHEQIFTSFTGSKIRHTHPPALEEGSSS